MELKNKKAAAFSQTTFTIDDLGVLRLSGISNSSLDNSEEAWVTTFRSPNSYLYVTSNAAVTPADSIGVIVNSKGWGFSARNGEFRIFHTDDPTKIVRYKYSGFNIGFNRIFDQMNHELPTANIQGLNYQ